MSNVLRTILLAGMILMASCTGSQKEVIGIVKILPEPVSLEMNGGNFELDETSFIIASEELKSTAQLFAEQIEEIISIKPAIASGAAEGIILMIDENINGEEEYNLAVSPEDVTISGKTEKGVFYGTQTFLQMILPYAKKKNSVKVSGVTINDYPRFKWRGIMLDESRHFFGVEFVKKLIDQMARLKLNIFHWHLIDDQGFRIEIKQYPKLTQIGAWRLDNENDVWNYSVFQPGEDDPKYGGFYTQEEIKDIVAYATERQITIVPEVEMPGHATSMIWAYPQLSCRSELWTIAEGRGFEFSDPLCAGNEKTFEILEGVLSEVIDLFPSYYIHIGGDECKKDPWGECPKCRKRMKEENLENLHQLQSYFIKRIEKFVRTKNRVIIGWDEILEGGLAPEAAVMSWRGYAGGIEAAEMGHEVVMSPTSFCYLDYYQGNPQTEPKAIGGNLPLRKVYEFDPIPKDLSSDKHHLILGGQANVWTEHIFDTEYCEYMTFPRAFAMAEVLWSQKEKLDFNDFLDRITPRYRSLASMGVNFRMPIAEGLGEKVLFKKEKEVELFNPFSDDAAKIHYTLDGTMPDEKSPLYEEPIKISKTSCLKAKIYYKEFESNVAVSWFFKFDPEINGLNCEYFEGQWTKLPDFDKLTSLEKYKVNDIQATAKSGAADNYGFRFTGFLDIEENGEYEFYTSSDDGSRLIIDGKVVVNYDGTHGADIRSNKIHIEKGKHAIEILYFEGTGGEYLEVGILSNDGISRPFNPSDLYLEKH